MPRPRQFDEDTALAAAMRLFWERGYAATSTEDLCRVTGLKRSSLYNTFTDKHRLFVLALKRYMDLKTGALEESLAAAGPVRERLRAVLWAAIDDERSSADGCLVVNSIMELARTDAEVARLLAADGGRRASALATVIAAGQRTGELSDRRSSAQLAEYLITVVGGLRVSARAGARPKALESVVEVAMAAL